MQRLLPPATLIILLILAAMMACSDPTPAPETVTPTSAPTPTAAPASTDAPVSTKTPTERPTAAPKATPANSPTPEATNITAPPGVLAPLQPLDSRTMFSELSEAEKECIGENTERQTKYVGCLEDETLVRIFLAGYVPGPGPLSQETSDCVRAAFEVIDPRAVMTAGIEGNSGRAMAGSMAAFSVTMACLNNEEWDSDALKMGIETDGREGMRCLLEQLGGPGEMAEAMIAVGEGDFTGLAQAGPDCGLNMGPAPGQAPARPTPAPTPTATVEAPTPASTKSDNRGNTVRDACGNRGNTGRDACDNRGNTARDARDTHSVTDPGTVDSQPDRMLGEFPVEPPVRGNDSDQVQVGSPGLRKDLFGVLLVFSPDVRSQFGSATKTAPRYGSIQSVEIALPHPDGRHGPVHGASESKYGCVARGQLTVVFNLEVQDRQFLLPSPCLWRHTNPLPSRFMGPEPRSRIPVMTAHQSLNSRERGRHIQP